MIDIDVMDWMEDPNISEAKGHARFFLVVGVTVFLISFAIFAVVLLFTFFPYIGLLLLAIAFYRFVRWTLEK